jgi:uncharacterized circularly permuted ATP-grasp superfamily protein/uncharacterized alpha-E superfamily protein
MSPAEPIEAALQFQHVAPAGVYDEAFEADGSPRPWWRELIEAGRQAPVDEFVRRSNLAEEQLIENGVTFNVFHEGSQLQRPWRLDLLPFLISAAEWRKLERALNQRARLLQWIVADCHGPRQLIHDGSLPPEVLFANPTFRRAFCGLHSGTTPFFSIYATELARGVSGNWCVMADRAEAPAGMAFALENRIVVSRTIPPALNQQPVHRLAPFFLQLQETLVKIGKRLNEHPRIVLLTGGATHPYYFEDVYLARYLGYSLVEGADLAVREDRVFLKTLAGLVPIDVIIARGMQRGIDPLELGGNDPQGVPGLLNAMRQGNVIITNTPGSGLIESPIFMAFLPELCRRCLDEDLLIPSIATWWCGNEDQFAFVKSEFHRLVIKPAFEASGSREVIVGKLSKQDQQKLLAEIEARPYQYVAQELVARSSVPVFRDGKVQSGHAAVRTFMVNDGRDFSLMPGGLVRIAPSADPMELSISAGVGSKDLWVLADEPVRPVTLLASQDEPVPLRRTSAIFPSRVADDLFWLGQSMDRADFLSRLLRATIDRLTTDTFIDIPELPALIRVLADQGQVEPGFAIDLLASPLPDFADELPRMVADSHETRGLAAAISEMQRLASLERLWISPDTWRKIRETAADFQKAAAGHWGGLAEVLHAINEIILDLAAVSGLIHDGMTRGPSWRLLDIGRRIERGRNIANFLRSILSTPNGGPIDRSVLKAVLEVIDCRMTYRARYLDNLQQNAVLDLCITDETCPRSVASQLVVLADHVDALPDEAGHPLRTEEKRAVMAALHAVRMVAPEQLARTQTDELRDTLIDIDQHLRTLADVLTRKYLLHSGHPRQITSEGDFLR